MYTGNADWTLIGEVKRNPRIHIPIIGNGDITSPEDAERAFNDYGVDAVMVGRATFGRPWIFKEMRDRLDDVRKTSRSHSTARLTSSRNSSASTWNASTNTGAYYIRAGILPRLPYSRAYPTSARRA